MMRLPRPPRPCQETPAVRFETLLVRPLPPLSEPLEAVSSVLGETVFLVATAAQAAQVAKKGGMAYSPEEVSILDEMARSCPPEEWCRRLKLIHEAKRQFQGQGER